MAREKKRTRWDASLHGIRLCRSDLDRIVALLREAGAQWDALDLETAARQHSERMATLEAEHNEREAARADQRRQLREARVAIARVTGEPEPTQEPAQKFEPWEPKVPPKSTFEISTDSQEFDDLVDVQAALGDGPVSFTLALRGIGFRGSRAAVVMFVGDHARISVSGRDGGLAELFHSLREICAKESAGTPPSYARTGWNLAWLALIVAAFLTRDIQWAGLVTFFVSIGMVVAEFVPRWAFRTRLGVFFGKEEPTFWEANRDKIAVAVIASVTTAAVIGAGSWLSRQVAAPPVAASVSEAPDAGAADVRAEP